MKLLIADDHTLFRDVLVQYLQNANYLCEIIVAKDFDEAYLTLQRDQNYDLVILDLRMPGMNGMGGFEKLRKEFPNLKAALMSGTAESADVKAATNMGACAYFPKTLSAKELVQAIHDVLGGDRYIPTLNGSEKLMPAYYADDVQGALSQNKKFPFTPREKEVLSFLAMGVSNKEIANALGLQVVTIKLHVRGICRKLETSNRTQAALKATQLGLVEASIAL